MSFKFKHLEKIVGVFLTVVLLIVIAVIVFIGREQRWFEKYYEFTTTFKTGENISPGTQVRIKGIQTGEVKSVFLTEDNLIEVTFSIYQEYVGRIRKDSIVKRRAPLIGTKFLEIIPGGKNMPILASGSYVWSEDSEEGARILSLKLVEEVPEQVQRIMNNVELLTYSLSAEEGKLSLTLDQVQDFFVMLSDEDGSLNLMLASLEEITRSIQDKEGSVGKLLNDDLELYMNIIALLENLNIMIANFQELSVALADSSPEIKAAVERSNRTMNEAIGLIKILENNFFVRGFSSRKPPTPVPIEGDVREGGYAPDVDYFP
jgi:phospholipid/cholesterol/gamma-HCH transport system substrate-binding protein